MTSITPINFPFHCRSARLRMLDAVKHLHDTGSLNRADIMRMGEVSLAQAAVDIRHIRTAYPNMMRYDQSAKCYVLVEC